MTTTLDSIHQTFLDWRRTHRAGRYPKRLQQWALSSLKQQDLIELGSRLGFTPHQIKQWDPNHKNKGVETEIKRDMAVAHSAFYEIKPNFSAPAMMEVELQMPAGPLLRLRGAIDTALLIAVVKTLHEANGL